MKTTSLLIGFVFLMAYQVIDARQLIQLPIDQAETAPAPEIVDNTNILSELMLDVALPEGTPFPDEPRETDPLPSLTGLQRVQNVQLAAAKCPEVCYSQYEPICAWNSRRIIFFYNNCKFERFKCFNPRIQWVQLPLDFCNKVHGYRSEESWSVESWGY